MKDYTELVFILDKSGSMHGLEEDTIGGFNSMIQKQQVETDGNAYVSTVLFNNSSQVLHDRVELGKIEPLTSEDYSVGGCTALLDATGDAIKHIRNVHKYAREEDLPKKTVFIITTDGMENASRKFTYGQVKRLIERQKKAGWEFVFLGANIDAAEVAESIGIERRRAVRYHSDKIGTEKVYGAMANFVACSMAPPSASHSESWNGEIDDEWRKELDEDFEKRK